MHTLITYLLNQETLTLILYLALIFRLTVLVIGGGGSASEYQGGGGGAGGAAYAAAWTISAPYIGTHPITVGTGGAGAPDSGNADISGNKGLNTVFNLNGNAITGLGGGGG